MIEERKKMELNGLSAPVLGGEERSDEVPSTGASSSRVAAPDPEVVAKPKRRRFTAEYRLRIVEEADDCSEPGDVGRLLRREGLYSSHLTKWREARRDGALHGLRSKKRGAKPKPINPLAPKVRELEAKVARLEKDLHTAHTILDVQEKVAGLLGFSLEDGKDC
jgi:transposase